MPRSSFFSRDSFFSRGTGLRWMGIAAEKWTSPIARERKKTTRPLFRIAVSLSCEGLKNVFRFFLFQWEREEKEYVRRDEIYARSRRRRRRKVEGTRNQIDFLFFILLLLYI